MIVISVPNIDGWSKTKGGGVLTVYPLLSFTHDSGEFVLEYMDLMENEISDKDVVELSKECISLLQKIFDTMASMGAANAPKNEVLVPNTPFQNLVE